MTLNYIIAVAAFLGTVYDLTPVLTILRLRLFPKVL